MPSSKLAGDEIKLHNFCCSELRLGIGVTTLNIFDNACVIFDGSTVLAHDGDAKSQERAYMIPNYSFGILSLLRSASTPV